jgi:pimeloyl-ACP methyl ester carboxylesterase
MTTPVWTGTETTNPLKYGYAPVNGIKLYYEIHGAGRPLVVLHGGLGASSMLAPILPALSADRQVIAVDMRAHGHTDDTDEPLRFERMADDVDGLLAHLGIEQADVMGYSLGGMVALRVAIQHPARVRKLVLASTIYAGDGWFTAISTAQKRLLDPETPAMMKETPMYKTYVASAPAPENFASMVGKVASLLQRPYDWSREVEAMKTPTMLVYGDADSVTPAHMTAFFGLLGGGKRDGEWDGSGVSRARLAILPGLTHYNVAISPAFVAAALPFLDAPA